MREKVNSIDGNLWKRMVVAGANALQRDKERINAMNVFPVPDGDTGTNMSMTFATAAKECVKVESPNIGDVAKAVSGGALRGARGNSGVILSQIMRGFTKGLGGADVASVRDIASAFVKAQETAYSAVMKPKEGTILTIARAMAEKAAEVEDAVQSIDELLAAVIAHGRLVLTKTPDMLPILKQAKVVDAGGEGLLVIWEAAIEALYETGEIRLEETGGQSSSANAYAALGTTATEDIKFAYCTEFFIINKGKEDDEEAVHTLKTFLDTIGDSIVAVCDGEIIKVHVHTNNPGAVLERALKIGFLDNIKIENMKQQHTSKINFSESAPREDDSPSRDDEADEGSRKPIGYVVVSAGDGFREIFRNLGADVVVEGGQTMNPSTEDFVNACARVNADSVIIMPNNSNIILAARQAAALAEGKKILVLPTKSVPQGVSAILSHNIEADAEENLEAMTRLIATVKTGQITVAVRDASIDGIDIKEGGFLCLYEGGVCGATETVSEGARLLIDKMLDENPDAEVASVFYGEGVAEEEAMDVAEYFDSRSGGIQMDVQSGGQPVYYYVFSVE